MVKKALLIGINYKDSEYELNGCINDVTDIKKILIENCSYTEDKIKLLSEGAAVRKNIEDEIKLLTSDLLKGDTLVFYYSGHGSNIKDKSKDESDGNDEVIVPFDFEKSGFITDDWLYLNLISKIPENVTLWCFTDCCNSGTLMDLKYNFKSDCEYKGKGSFNNIQYKNDEWGSKFSFNIEDSKNIKGNVYLFSGCQDPETSEDANINGKSQGAFTHCLIDILKNNMQKMSNNILRFKNGELKLINILKELNCRLDISGYSQNSQLSLGKQIDLERTLDF